MVPDSTRNWIAGDAVQQSKPQKNKHMKTLTNIIYPAFAAIALARLCPAVVVVLLVWGGLVLVPLAQAGHGDGGQHGPIVIRSDADFAGCGCVVSGSGTNASPYIIGPWTINNVNGNAVDIDGSTLTKSFVLYNLTIAGNSTPTDTGIVLKHINPGGTQTIVAAVSGLQTSIQTNNVGILVDTSSYVTLDGGGANPRGPGISDRGAGTINRNASGAIDVENSSYVTIKGWQLSTNGADGSPDWINFDPSISNWFVGGVRFMGVTNSTIDHNAANNCTSVSYSLFNSSYNTIVNNTADYPFTMNVLVTDGSSNNAITGNVMGTGDFIGLLIADPLPGTWTLTTFGPSHDNTVTGNVIHTDGPIGNELTPVSICPAFLGGIVLLNGTYNNTILNNQTWASFGTDLAWAQAVPDNSTAIGVKTYPPTLHCNVTAYDGSGSAPPLNGNAWIGNTYRTIDPCLPAQ
jgi:hypothetical protein